MRFVLILACYGYLFFYTLLLGQYTLSRNPISGHFSALAKVDSRIADYRLDKRAQAHHRLLSTPLSCEFDASYRLLRIEENSFDESVVITQIFQITETVYGISQSIRSPLSTDNSLYIWEKKGRKWQNISSVALPPLPASAKASEKLISLDACPPSVRGTLTNLPLLYSFDPATQLLQHHIDASALRSRCEQLQGENPNANRLPPVCELLQCAEFSPAFYTFDAERKQFAPIKEK